MTIAILSAMPEELSAVLALMPDEQPKKVAGREFWCGHLQGHDVVAVLSRIGKVAAAPPATVLIEHFGVQRMMFTGVAGGLHPDVRVGDVVVASHFMQHDLDVSPLFPRYTVPYYDCDRFAADATLSAALQQAAGTVLQDPAAVLGAKAVQTFGLNHARLHHGLVVSGDRFVATALESNRLRSEHPHALAVEMECAAVAQVCHDYGVPFAAVRTVSDRADDTAHVDFARFLAQVASRYSAATVNALLKGLS